MESRDDLWIRSSSRPRGPRSLHLVPRTPTKEPKQSEKCEPILSGPKESIRMSRGKQMNYYKALHNAMRRCRVWREDRFPWVRFTLVIFLVLVLAGFYTYQFMTNLQHWHSVVIGTLAGVPIGLLIRRAIKKRNVPPWKQTRW